MKLYSTVLSCALGKRLFRFLHGEPSSQATLGHFAVAQVPLTGGAVGGDVGAPGVGLRLPPTHGLPEGLAELPGHDVVQDGVNGGTKEIQNTCNRECQLKNGYM